MPSVDWNRKTWTNEATTHEGDKLYGMRWGDPLGVPFLKSVLERFLLPNVTPETVALEIGPGGGRWTQFMIKAKHIYLVDLNPAMFELLRKAFPEAHHLTFVTSSGGDFPGVPHNSVDFVFSFGVFVHIDHETISTYLNNLRSVLKPSGKAIIQYADQRKKLAQETPEFSKTTPDIMRAMVRVAGFRIIDEDLDTLPHSSVVVFQP